MLLSIGGTIATPPLQEAGIMPEKQKRQKGQALSLHVPEPAVRPGGKPDFSNVPIAEAGSVPRPEITVDPRDIRDLAFSIIRVLNRKGEAVGPWAGLLSDADLLEGLRHMLTLRTFDTRMQMAQRQG